ncbi:MAG: acetylxylan esterase [Acidobacteria bacterium]|nr:acetylxylan esterase [Acidobacteriota bacterium]
MSHSLLHRRDFLKQTASTVAVGPSLSSMTTTQSPKTKSDFTAYQQRRRRELWSLLGDLPLKHRPKPAKLITTEKGNGYTLEHLELDLNGIEPVPALLLIPEKRQKPAPGLLYIHWHGGTYPTGKKELLQGQKVLPSYAPVVAEKGIVTLAIDSWCFGARQHNQVGRTGEEDTFKQMLWYGQVLFGMMMFDEHRAVDYLISRTEVDPKRIGAFGLSMGSTKAWWLAALDPRIKLCIDLCCLTDFEELIKINNLRGHGIYYYVPRLLNHFQTHQINELIVPRPHLSLNGRKDPLTPPAGVERVRDHLTPLYQKFGKADDCRIELFDCGHEETPEMRRLVLEWMDRHLVGS